MTAASNPSISDPKTETEPRSCRVIFTCVKMKIATLPLVYKGATLFTPKKLGNLQQHRLHQNAQGIGLDRVLYPSEERENPRMESTLPFKEDLFCFLRDGP